MILSPPLSHACRPARWPLQTHADAVLPVCLFACMFYHDWSWCLDSGDDGSRNQREQNIKVTAYKWAIGLHRPPDDDKAINIFLLVVVNVLDAGQHESRPMHSMHQDLDTVSRCMRLQSLCAMDALWLRHEVFPREYVVIIQHIRQGIPLNWCCPDCSEAAMLDATIVKIKTEPDSDS